VFFKHPIDMMPMAYCGFRATFIPAGHPAFKGKELKTLRFSTRSFYLNAQRKSRRKALVAGFNVLNDLVWILY